MIFQKLLKLTIMDALDRVWSESGITPSKKTRRTILKASEKISLDMEEDFRKANKTKLLAGENWHRYAAATPRMKKSPPSDAETEHVHPS